MDGARQKGWSQNVQLGGGRAKVVQTHLLYFVRASLSAGQRPILVRYSVPAVELHVGGTKAGSQKVKNRHAADASVPGAVSKHGKGCKEGATEERATSGTRAQAQTPRLMEGDIWGGQVNIGPVHRMIRRRGRHEVLAGGVLAQQRGCAAHSRR